MTLVHFHRQEFESLEGFPGKGVDKIIFIFYFLFIFFHFYFFGGGCFVFVFVYLFLAVFCCLISWCVVQPADFCVKAGQYSRQLICL